MLFLLATLSIVTAQYEGCTDAGGYTDNIGDQICDMQNNNIECGYDGGDCCPSTNVELTATDECLDPGATENEATENEATAITEADTCFDLILDMTLTTYASEVEVEVLQDQNSIYLLNSFENDEQVEDILYCLDIASSYEVWYRDSYGDGWHGGRMQIAVNGETVLDTLPSGYGDVFYICQGCDSLWNGFDPTNAPARQNSYVPVFSQHWALYVFPAVYFPLVLILFIACRCKKTERASTDLKKHVRMIDQNMKQQKQQKLIDNEMQLVQQMGAPVQPVQNMAYAPQPNQPGLAYPAQPYAQQPYAQPQPSAPAPAYYPSNSQYPVPSGQFANPSAPGPYASASAPNPQAHTSQAPDPYAPQAPDPYAPQAPGPYAPQAPDPYAPQYASPYASQAAPPPAY